MRRKPSGFRSKGRGKNRKVYPVYSGGSLGARAQAFSVKAKKQPKKPSNYTIPQSVPTYAINSNISTKDLVNAEQRQHLKLYKMQQAVSRGDMSDVQYEAYREKVWKAQDAKKPDLRPIIYKTSIGHYGGMYVMVPDKHYREFKSHFPSREFPRAANIRKEDIREVYSIQGEQNYRKRFPNSNYMYSIHFADATKGDRRLEFMKIPRSD